mmetsp:Transcript_25766/g.49082  ORF Transcript_25766/g.49082 Transcript_25766/m.49082 type:complete len:80 (-) Transcript_25766:384-623(-)
MPWFHQPEISPPSPKVKTGFHGARCDPNRDTDQTLYHSEIMSLPQYKDKVPWLREKEKSKIKRVVILEQAIDCRMARLR